MSNFIGGVVFCLVFSALIFTGWGLGYAYGRLKGTVESLERRLEKWATNGHMIPDPPEVFDQEGATQ